MGGWVCECAKIKVRLSFIPLLMGLFNRSNPDHLPVENPRFVRAIPIKITV